MGALVPHHYKVIPADFLTKTLDELVQIALAATDDRDHLRWHAITVLQSRGGREVFEEARRLITSPNPKRRELGVDLLGQNVARVKTFHDESVSELLFLLERQREPSVLASIGNALGNRRDARAVMPLLRLKNHPDEHVRFGVVCGLTGHADPAAVAALIELSDDPDSDVRDWATFGLGSLIDLNTPELREALVRRLADTDADTVREAEVGLARRQDARCVPSIVKTLSEGWDGSGIRDAVEAFPHPDVRAALERESASGDERWQSWARGVLDQHRGIAGEREPEPPT